MNKNRISWNHYFMDLAQLTSKRSKDPKTQVGAVIVDESNGHILSIGYNGLPLGMKDTDDIWDTDKKHMYVVHAEANAILNTDMNLEGKTLYVTMFPCNECAKLLAQKKIAKVVYRDDKYLYKDSGSAAMEIFKAAGIKVKKYKEEE